MKSSDPSFPLWKSASLHAYYQATRPWRAWEDARRRAAGRSPICILFYHRVANDRANPWTTPERIFARQIDWLAQHFDLLSLEEAQQRLRSGFNDHPAVCLTFDDGYADNLAFALPRLLEAKIPCTYFVSTEHVLTGKPFPHDLARNQPLAPNSIPQLRELAAAGLEIGAHTRTHADLGRVRDSRMLFDEVVTAGAELQTALGRPIRYFAFPYGQHWNLSVEAFELAHEAGYDGVCSAYGGYNFPGDDAFHLQRIAVDDDLIRLKNWLTLDPRKVAAVRRFEYLGARLTDAALEARVEVT